jgi:hypothetical protein
MSNNDYCRCGHNGDGPHPCHGVAYTCRQPATIRFFADHNASLVGAQMKFSATTTFACDKCWDHYLQMVQYTSKKW